MALKATVLKAELQVSDLDRGYYATHALTIAKHPSETDERVMVRILAFALHASETLAFGRGISAEDEADLWEHDLTGSIELWIAVGLPDTRALRKASGRARTVVAYSYGRNASLWWTQGRADFEKIRNLSVIQIDAAATLAMASMVQRAMTLNCLVQDQVITLSDPETSVEVALTVRQSIDDSHRPH